MEYYVGESKYELDIPVEYGRARQVGQEDALSSSSTVNAQADSVQSQKLRCDIISRLCSAGVLIIDTQTVLVSGSDQLANAPRS